MNGRRIVVAALMLLLGFAQAVIAQSDAETEQMLGKIAESSANVESFRVDIKIESPVMGQAMVTNGEMAFKKPGMMHMKTSSNMMGMEMEQETFAKDNIVWSYMPTMKMATKIDLGKAGGEMLNNSMGPGQNVINPFKGIPREKTKYVETKTVDDTEVHVFETASPMPGQMPQGGDQPTQLTPSKLMIMVSTDTGLPYKMRMLGPDDSLMMEQTYSNYRINIEIDDSEFEFTPPEDVQVMDMTQGAMNMMQKMQGETPPTE